MDYEQKRLGADGDELSSLLYAGSRATTQFQAIPQATEERSPLNPGGVIDLQRALLGASIRT